MPRFTGFVLRYFRDTNGSLMWMDLDSGIRIVNVYAPGDFRSQKEFFAVLDDHLVGPSRVVLGCHVEGHDGSPLRGFARLFAGRVPKGTTNLELAKAFLERFKENDLKSVQDFGGSNFEVTFRNKVAVDRFLADSATIKVKETGIRFEYRGLRTVSVCVYEYPAEASDKVLSRALEVYGKVQNMSDDNLTGLRITTGNRRARMELRSPVPNIADVDGTSFGASTTALCACVPSAGCRVTKEKCAPRHGAHGASSGGPPTCDAPCKRCGGDHPPHLCKQRLYSEAATRPSVPQVAPPAMVSAEGQGAPAPTISDKGEQGKALEAAPGEAEVKKSDKKEPEPVEAPLTASKKPAQRADTHLCGQRSQNPSRPL
ncbi:hypothetical protein MRX96_024283 [Rhipicephalus microplus]